MKRYIFVDKIIALIREKLENKLPKEASLDEMMEKSKEILKDIL